MISVRNISFHVGKKALLSGIDMDLRPGQVTALVGPNGAGKSTLISILSGERRPSQGMVSMEGKPLSRLDMGELARRRAVLLQDTSLEFAFTVEEVVELGRIPHAGHPSALHDQAAIDAACRLAGIEYFRHRSYQTLSGGEKQRVQFARALAQIWQPARLISAAPRYLILDEPTSALDLRHQRMVLAVARQLADEGVGVLAAIHDLNLALACADKFVLLRDGHLLASGTPAETMDVDTLRACFDVEMEILTRRDGSLAILA